MKKKSCLFRLRNVSSRWIAAALVSCGVLVANAATTNSWILDGDGNWNTPENWSPAEVPNAPGSMAILDNNLTTASRSITNDVNVTLGHLRIDGPSTTFIFSIVTNETASSWKVDNNGEGAHFVSTAAGVLTSGDRINVPVELADNLTVLTATRGLTFGREITESGSSRSIVKTGGGYLVLSSSLNSFSGGITVKAGRLNAPGTGRTGTGVITLGDDNGSANAELMGAGTYPSAIIVAAGSTGRKIMRNSGTGGNTTFGGPVTLNDTVTLDAGASTGFALIGGEISGTGAIIASSQAGRQATNFTRLRSPNSFTGGVTLQTGNLRLNGHEALGTGTFTIQGNTIISSDGNSNRQPTNAVVVNGNFQFGHTNGIPSISTSNGALGTIRFRGPVDLGSGMRTITLGSTVSHSFESTVSGTGGIIVEDNVTTNINKNFGLSGQNTFEGGVTILNGTILFAGDSALGTGPVTLGSPNTVKDVQLTGNGTVTNDISVVAGVSGTRILQCSANLGTAIFSGSINLGTDLILGGGSSDRAIVVSGPVSGTGSLTMNGGVANRFQLSGASTYEGTTTLNGGTLNVANTTGSATSVGTLTINSGATLSGNGTMDSPATLASGATLAPGVNDLGLLTFNNTLTLLEGSTNAVDLNKTLGTNDVVVANSVIFSGVLVVNNLGGELSDGDTFKLFNTTAANSGNFSEIILVGSTLQGQFDPATGVLTIIGNVVLDPTSISFSFSEGSLSLSWPETHLGAVVQSNSVDIANSAAWVTIEGSGSATNLNIVVDSLAPQTFFRLANP